MTLGDLADMLQELRDAEHSVVEWAQSLDRTHLAEDTRARRQEALADAKEYVARLRAQEIPN